MKKLHWPLFPLHYQITFKLCTLMHGIHHDRCPEYMKEMMVPMVGFTGSQAPLICPNAELWHRINWNSGNAYRCLHPKGYDRDLILCCDRNVCSEHAEYFQTVCSLPLLTILDQVGHMSVNGAEPHVDVVEKLSMISQLSFVFDNLQIWWNSIEKWKFCFSWYHSTKSVL